MKSGFNKHDIARDACQLFGAQAHQGYDWWWHSFTGYDAETGESKPFFIEFFLCNPVLGEEEPVFGQLPGKAQKPSYLMVKAGAWGEDAAQLHRFWGWKRIKVDWGVPFSVAAEDCFLSEDSTHGHVKIEGSAAHPEWMCDAGEMAWDLQVDKKLAFNVGYGASRPLRAMQAFAMYWHAEGMKTAYSGTIVYNGRKYIVTPEKCYGYSDKNWGRDFTTPWVWLSSNCLVSKKSGKKLENSVFDIGGGRPKVYFVPLDRRLLGVLYYEGREYDFNFSKFHLRVKTDFSFEEREDFVVWKVRQENIRAVMETEVCCRKSEMLLINYEAPDGSKRHTRLWNGGTGRGTVKLYDKTGNGLTLVDEIEATHIGCEYGEYDRTDAYDGAED